LFPFHLGIIDNTKKLEAGTVKSSFKNNNNKGIVVSTINFNTNITAAKTKEMILKKLIRRSKDTLGAPKNNKVAIPPPPCLLSCLLTLRK
jgi:hypothetical protein